ncbi:radical SAM protein [Eubacterium callanderi]|uniref:radical SAM protein n=1 Tax=Eubacterium callanderi TaxID=53442 RepID=UPI001C10AC7A|nr:radical SAM protein [Eubacterium callanderi]MBU5304911.1 radical SAM protein [Eubacterium callanderi]
MRYEGRVFRPPSEAYSLIIQATVGCSHNKCRFCDMYKEKSFHVRPLEDVIGDLKQAREAYGPVNRIFLADGDALVRRFSDLEAILGAIQEIFPECDRVTSYGSPRSILIKTPEQLRRLRALGLKMIYMGLESGSDAILSHVNKGETAAEIIKAGRMVREAGMKLSVTAISGLGGKARWQEHAVKTAEALNAMNPEYIGLLTFRLEGQAPMIPEVERGDFQMLTPIEVARETLLMMEHLDSPGSVFRSNHISNYINLSGTLNQDKPRMLAELHEALGGRVAFKSEEMRNLDLKFH